MPITGTTQILGVIGDPVTHSLSPVMHNAALAELGADYVYVAFPVLAEGLEAAIAGFAATGVQGFSITIPHKQAILPLLATVTDEAQAVGAVNTVWRTEQGWAGTNTDVAGFVAPLKAFRPWAGCTALVLGNGGAARAVVAGCAQLGFDAVQVVGRRAEALVAFQQGWVNSPLQPPLTVHAWEELPTLLPTADLIVNTTPLGMHTTAGQTPLAAEALALAPSHAVVYDLIYTPRPTRLLALADQRGLSTLDGLEMLVQQGAAALEIWLNCPVPVDTMRQALIDWLER
ncbi:MULTISPECIES: shikimate dehydrogenase [Cyanophyceae]|uniref:Shikimate dehydrogenase (NADP(+)) n=1 Tax=Leptolyngbya subtilissima DQ-A4 TaxID=2933933 RepID=A0ABV0K1I2_9CYAN|nr:shikimate dehydrogenase [Nodosilinea sp. FACHB-141]MBD2111417.1 shikimate dehydrogenase [Nodosilinea sp. FACHB-141]